MTCEGEKGILIIAPIVRRKETDEAREPETTEERSVVAFRSAYVFDMSQTHGQPLPEIACVHEKCFAPARIGARLFSNHVSPNGPKLRRLAVSGASPKLLSRRN